MGAEHLPYLAHLRKRDDDAIASEYAAVLELQNTPGWALVMELIETVHGEAVTRLLMGHAGQDGRILDQAEYARLLGFLSGLRQTRWAAEAFIEYAERVQAKETNV